MSSCARTAGPLAIALLSSTVLRADVIPPWDQTDMPFGGGINVTGLVTANDFVLASATTITGATLWLADGVTGDNATLDSFGGGLSWGMYTASGGAPAGLIQSGPAVNVTLTDAGQDLGLDADVFQISFELSEAVALAPGTYFLAIHEGPWGSGNDGSNVYWMKSSAVVGAALHYSTNLATPGSWAELPSNDLAFSLYGSAAAWSQSLPVGSFGWNITAFLVADDVVFEAETSFSTLDVWLMDGFPSDNGVLEFFNGTLSWGIYEDAGGSPGTLLLSGTDPSPSLADTGRQSDGSDLIRARIHLEGRQTLAAGTYWIALHEGAWGDPSDGSSIYWNIVSGITGGAAQIDPNPSAPSSWGAVEKASDTAFILFDDQLFASGFEAGGACAWTNGAAIDCP